MRHFGPISGVAALDDRYVATAGYDNLVVLWDFHRRTPLTRVFHDHLANQCAFSSCGRLLVSASSDYTARVWDVPTMRLRAVLGGHDDDVEMAAFDPSSTRVATCSRDHTIRVFSSGGDRLLCLHGHGQDVISVTWSADGRSLISSSDDGTVRRWDLGTAEEKETISLGGAETDTVVIRHDGLIVAGNDNGELVAIRNGEQCVVPGHSAGIKRLVLDTAGDRLVSLSYDRQAVVWDVSPEGELRRRSSTSLPGIVWPRSAAFAGADHLVFGTFGSSFATLRLSTGEWLLDHVMPDESVNAVALLNGERYWVGDAGRVYCEGRLVRDLGSLCNFLLPYGGTLITGGQEGIVWDVLSGQAIHQHRSPLNCGATFTRAGGRWAILGTYTGEGVVLRCAGRSVEYAGAVKLHENAVKGIAASDRFLFSVCATGAAAWHRCDDFSLADDKPRGHEKIANGCASLPDGRFVSVSRDLKLRIWTDGEAETIPTPHRNSIKCVAVAADGGTVATGSYTGYVAIWDMARREWTAILRPTASGISSIAAGPGPGRFTASSYDGGIHAVTA